MYALNIYLFYVFHIAIVFAFESSFLKKKN